MSTSTGISTESETPAKRRFAMTSGMMNAAL
jgi:hypothetical protein